MRAAADVSRRDAIAQAWLLGQNLQAGDLAQAMSRLDLIFRIQNSGVSAKLVSLLLPLLSHDEARRELAKRLAARPPWRSGFLSQVSREAQDLNAVSALYSALSEASAPPLTEELRPFLDRLIGAGQVEQAYLVWMQSLAPERLSTLGHLYNAGFEYPVSNLPFDWVFPPMDSAAVEVSSESSAGPASRVYWRPRVAAIGIPPPRPATWHLPVHRTRTVRFAGE